MLRGWACALVLGLAAAPLAAQLSPGPLSRPHAALEGSANCLACHAPGQGASAAKCLDCHTALKQRIAARQGLHARPGHQKCESCHNEHHGREFQLVYWGKAGQASFDHRQTGFPLVGAHAGRGCRDCHRPAFIRNPQTLQAGRANPSQTFLGLSTACLSCHRDEHRQQFAANSCLSCHTMASWQKRTFDHAKTSFPLTGQHQAVACASCHPSRSDPKMAADPDKQLTVFKDIRHAACSDCHKDPHQGTFGAACRQCHSTAGWKQGARASFDHERTGFPLTGQHRNVACASCHKTRDAAGAVTFRKMAHGKCSDCHRDPHQGRLGATCQTCHSTAGWKTGAVRAGFDHDKTRFPLRGEHREVSCQSCHSPGKPMRIARFDRCADCHRDPHAGQLAARTCEICHTVAGFSPSKFTLEEHQKTRFPLQGAHLAVPCIACHEKAPPDRPEPGMAKLIRLRFPSTACAACHGDPHQGEVDRFVAQGGCETCHSMEGFGRVIFDHSRARFQLEGAHRTVPCGGCHKAEVRDGRRIVRFKPLPVTCEGCHAAKPAR